ncbi:MAG: PAS domain S-box protein [Deltaproteobacteria bacterium]|nr:PAS domain S-box protein [Deltaproteobacteria bacterium]
MNQDQNETQKTELKRRQRERYLIIAIAPVIMLLTYVESHISIISGDIPVATNILVLGLINLNIILLLLLIYLIIRNAVKLFFESRRSLLGSKLRTKLVAAFVGLTIVPTFILFFIVIGFINKSIDGWFDIKLEEALIVSLDLARDYYKDSSDKILSQAWIVADKVGTDALIYDSEKLNEFIELKISEGDFSTIEVFDAFSNRVAYAISGKVSNSMVPDVDTEQVGVALREGAFSFVETLEVGDVVRGVALIPSSDLTEGSPDGVVVIGYYISGSIVAKMDAITSTFEGYKQLKILKNPVKATYFTILLVITLLIVFFSIWIGQYMAKEITGPIFELAEGTHAVASGNLDYIINVESKDEVGQLVKSFNRMTMDLKAGKTLIEQANLELRGTNVELESRRRYIEIVLGNIPAGVVSIDRGGKITSLNKVAAEILGLNEADAPGKNYKDIMRPEDRDVLKDMIREMNELTAEYIERQMKVTLEDRVMTVLVNLNALRDENGEYLGMVAVLDDLTHLLKTQRMVAWKEVARRIAHEIKNPLTPIQLSAQRLRKKYLKVLPKDNQVFDECTSTIINQVDEIKTLVNEFSTFARMPASEPTSNDLNALVSSTVALYKSAHKEITFNLVYDKKLPVFDFDRDQMNRVLINLLDNSIAALSSDGVISLETHYDPLLKIARVEVVDNGSGIPPEDKSRLFEPYFSTKKSGTGLGLAIVNDIIADHNGYIRVKDNSPKGTRFVIELPLTAVVV